MLLARVYCLPRRAVGREQKCLCALLPSEMMTEETLTVNDIFVLLAERGIGVGIETVIILWWLEYILDEMYKKYS